MESLRKQRRNRMPRACINCHTSKRKCDKKRPCSRCIQLGITGLCLYETGDTSPRNEEEQDELTRCRARIAELEAVLREIRGKPHPKWVEPKGQTPAWTIPSYCSDSSTEASDCQSIEYPEGDDIPTEHLNVEFLQSFYHDGQSFPSSNHSTVSQRYPFTPPDCLPPSMIAMSHDYDHKARSIDYTMPNKPCACEMATSTVLPDLSKHIKYEITKLQLLHGNDDDLTNCSLHQFISRLSAEISIRVGDYDRQQEDLPYLSHTACQPQLAVDSNLAHALQHPLSHSVFYYPQVHHQNCSSSAITLAQAGPHFLKRGASHDGDDYVDTAGHTRHFHNCYANYHAYAMPRDTVHRSHPDF